MPAPKKTIPDADLEAYQNDPQMTLAQIASKNGLAVNTVRARFLEAGIEIRRSGPAIGRHARAPQKAPTKAPTKSKAPVKPQPKSKPKPKSKGSAKKRA